MPSTVTHFLLARPALSHVVVGLLMQLGIAAPLIIGRILRAWWFGAAATIAFYFSRKKLQMEQWGVAHHSHAPWRLGFDPLHWPGPYQIQFYAPAVAVILMALLAEEVGRRLIPARASHGRRPASDGKRSGSPTA